MTDTEALALIDAALASRLQLAAYVIDTFADGAAMAERILDDDFRLFIPKDAKEAFDRWEADQIG